MGAKAETAHLANVFGAAVLATSDRVTAAVADATGLEGQGVAALVLIGMRPGRSIKRLAERLRLSHPGAVRLVDGLAARGLLEKAEAEDRRAVRLSLTPLGARVVKAAHSARAAQLEALIATIPSADRAAFARALAGILAASLDAPVDAYAHCRLCDERLCVARGCPIESAAHALFAADAQDEGETR